MRLDQMYDFIAEQREGLKHLEYIAANATTKAERSVVCRSMHRLSQSIAKLRADIYLEIESRR